MHCAARPVTAASVLNTRYPQTPPYNNDHIALAWYQVLRII